MLQLNKKAVSLMVGYVLLIAIAIALSTAVFFYLKLYLPDDKQECDVDVKLTIDKLSCNINSGGDKIVDILITNRGLFKIDGASIKIGNVGRAYKIELNPNPEIIYECGTSDSGLNPGKESCPNYLVDSSYSGPKEISVQPIVDIDGSITFCSNAVVTKIVNCP